MPSDVKGVPGVGASHECVTGRIAMEFFGISLSVCFSR